MRRVAWVIIGAWALSVGPALAEADGPDYFKVVNIRKDDNLNVRNRPNADARIVGKIPKDADGLKNLGCRGGLSAKQFEKASEKRKKAAERTRWCRISYEDITGWVAARYLAEGTGPDEKPKAEPKQEPVTPPPPAPPPAAKIEPSFDCEKAEKNVEKLICGDGALAALDREIARLDKLVTDALNATPAFGEVLDARDRWLTQRSTCFEAECVADISVRRIHRLRERQATLRKDEGEGISVGPIAARCEGLATPLSVTFVNAGDGYVYAEWDDERRVLKRTPAASGTRYEANGIVFWAKGEMAMLTLPGRGEVSCNLRPGG